jgi:hypothetical protein
MLREIYGASGESFSANEAKRNSLLLWFRRLPVVLPKRKLA